MITRKLFPLMAVWLLSALFAAGPAPLYAQEESEAKAQTTGQAEEEQRPLTSPREAMHAFLSNILAEREGEKGAWRDAIRTMELDYLPEIGFDKEARDAAILLHEVINRVEYVDLESIPGEEFQGQRYVWKQLPSGSITMVQDREGSWKFSQETIQALPGMLVDLRDSVVADQLGDLQKPDLIHSPDVWLRLHLPKWVFRRAFVLENFQWLGLLITILAGLIADRILRFLINRITERQFDRKSLAYDREQLGATAKWCGLLASGIVWLIGLDILGLPDKFQIILRIAAGVFAVTAGILAAFRIIDLVTNIFERKAAKTATKFDDVLVPLMRTCAKIFVSAFGLVFIADNLEIDITSLLAGLGIGGLAFALAAKDTVENLFGSITVLIDRPFNIGDWINVDGVDGHVEKVGMRSTRVRTFYNSLITVPNSNLIKATVDNYGRRKYRRIKTTLSVTYNTPPERIEAFTAGIRTLILRHPYTRKDYFHVWFNDFGSHSLDILLYCFVETPDWATELRERHRLFLDIMRLAHRLGIEFAFPTQTLYLERGGGPAQPDPAPFEKAGDVERAKSRAMRDVEEIVSSLLRAPGEKYPPPPVSFPLPPADSEHNPQELRKGGDSGQSS